MKGSTRLGHLARRTFLRMGAAGIAASVLPVRAMSASARQSDPQVRRYATLGRTGLEISDVSFGSSRLRPGQEDLVRHALERGINYIDTAESYSRGASETVIGNALRGKRDRVFIASKMHVGARTSARTMMATLEESLR
ncbi:MAG: aldo/keto reductase, partial [Gammaproteobacteria bacterium]